MTVTGKFLLSIGISTLCKAILVDCDSRPIRNRNFPVLLSWKNYGDIQMHVIAGWRAIKISLIGDLVFKNPSTN